MNWFELASAIVAGVALGRIIADGAGRLLLGDESTLNEMLRALEKRRNRQRAANTVSNLREQVARDRASFSERLAQEGRASTDAFSEFGDRALGGCQVRTPEPEGAVPGEADRPVVEQDDAES